ncbi:hydroxymethylbilane synthase [Croceivirga lutea]|uniref:hydroxymethylbilane synthase n=1 Tax=Croceivirga lutea TaxID=1775167 RepID=UPI00163B3C31|nr:hydroxymethylbilane synthase [Croceivirga lutea]GGG39681.1 hydroxymethylbilane synthase [Croceivirga lutea]
MSKVIRIGTRDSELALWQATTVQNKLEELGFATVLVPVKSDGDLILDKPLYELGITGVFTKTLDIALIKGDIDIAVHSMKDVPTALPKGVVQTAVLERAANTDVLVHLGLDFLEGTGTLATGSLRRRAQWLNRYPSHNVVDLRGNVNTRLIKIIENGYNGAIFAKAGLQRIKLLPKDAVELDWMIPAPAQGAMLIVALENNKEAITATKKLNHPESEIAVTVERQFLRTLEGGCTAPIGAIATIKEQTVFFKGALFSLDGKTKIEIEKTCPLAKVKDFGAHCAKLVLADGGKELMESIKNEISSIN